jgi:PhnB protein
MALGKRPMKKARKKVQPIPAGYHAVTPYLSIRGAAQAIDFYKKAFGALEIMRMPGPGGLLGHAEIRIGDSRVMLSDEYAAMDFLGPRSRGGSTVHIHLYVKDADAVAERAVAAGARLVRPVEDKFYGDRTGTVEDPFGHVWHLATHTRDLSMAELRRGAAEAAKQAGGG